jgi:hypothetical protein
MSGGLARHFAFKHPLFRKAESDRGVSWKQSIYFLWWEYLRRNEGYRRTCQNRGNGRYARLYQDFGDVHAGDFKSWWTKGERGVRLFSEPALPNSIVVVSAGEAARLDEAVNSGALLLVAIPLVLRKKFISKKLEELLGKHHHRRRGERTLRDSKALYPLATQFSFRSIKMALDAYDLRVGEPSLKLWQIGQKLKLGDTLTEAELAAPRGRAGADAVNKKNVLAVATSRKLKMAEHIIDGVGRGKFPVFTT